MVCSCCFTAKARGFAVCDVCGDSSYSGSVAEVILTDEKGLMFRTRLRDTATRDETVAVSIQ